jgi:hypothetical protein
MAWQNLVEFHGMAEFGRILWHGRIWQNFIAWQNLAEFYGMAEFGRIPWHGRIWQNTAGCGKLWSHDWA